MYSRAQDSRAVELLLDAAEALGGWLDGLTPGRVIALTLPAEAGFPAVERLLNDYAAAKEPSGSSPTSTGPTT